MTESDIVVIGAGQLARMMQAPALAMGVRLQLLAEAGDASAAQVIVDHVVGDYTDLDTLRTVAKGSSVITFDHEHVPENHLRALVREGYVCRPGPQALRFAQDKAQMRRRLDALGVPIPRYALVSTPAELDEFAAATGGYPVIVKTARGGYDGKGVWVVNAGAEADGLFAMIASGGGEALVAEENVDFRRELSAVVARRPSGESVNYPVVESVQTDGICTEVIAPAPGASSTLAAEADRIAGTIAEALDVTGIMAVELFETADGELLVNELAMRPHNTGHWSIEGAATSQFENHLRAVLDEPLGPTTHTSQVSVMVNLLGSHVQDLDSQRTVALEAEPGAHIHLYGKRVTPGRKVGHVTVCGDDLGSVRLSAHRAAALVQDGR